MLSILQIEETNLLLLRHSYFVQSTVNGCNDFLAQSILVRILNYYHYCCHYFIHANYSKDLPLLDYMESQYLYCDFSFNLSNRFFRSVRLSQAQPEAIFFFLSWLFNLFPLGLWLACATSSASRILPTGIQQAPWGTWMGVAGIILSMIVNAYATGFIAFKIFKVYHYVKPTSELGTLGSYGGIKYRNIISIIIESGMALFCIQFIRVVLVIYFAITGSVVPVNALEIIIAIQEILNVSIIFLTSLFIRIITTLDNMGLCRT